MAHRVLEIAKVCHQANLAMCQAFGDRSAVPWDDAPEWQKLSAKRGVQYAIANPDATPEDQHNAWMADKIKDGWVHGKVKDPAAKTHPCIAPYLELPVEQRVKDHVFRAIVRAMTAG